MIHSKHDGSVFYDSVTMWAFGPVFSSEEAIEKFAAVMTPDPRGLDAEELQNLYTEFLRRFECECGDIRNELLQPEPKDEHGYICPDCLTKPKKGGRL